MMSSDRSNMPHNLLRTCGCCGLIQQAPAALPHRMRACCARCGCSIDVRAINARSNSRAAAFAAAALILYPAAVTLPMIRVEQLGHDNEASILEGITSLFSAGHMVVGLVVLFCSVIFPLGKLIALLGLTLAGTSLAHHHRRWTWRLIEWTGKWGMLDVVLVAMLVAILKLGDMVSVSAGPAALLFTGCVVFNLIAAACFDPRRLWEEQ